MTGTPNRPIVAPYITAWSCEQDLPYRLITIPGIGIGYADESPVDRDRNGILWYRAANSPGEGHPDFGRVHPHRQRRAMLRLLCQVCAGPAYKTDDGVLWLLQDHRDDWPDWPNAMGVTEPPICRPCATMSMARCPALRKGSALIRARHYPVSGVYGALHIGPNLTAVDALNVPLDDPYIPWLRAHSLIRQLNDCTLIPPADFTDEP
jgi:hypothetical protein